jgi:aspartate ammonia-lyase
MAYRIEKDFLGEKQIPDDAYYGIQTLRGKENFHITGLPVSREPYFVKAFGYVKKPPPWQTGTSACSTPRSPTPSSARATG